MPIDLAVIPSAMTASTAQVLAARYDQAPQLLGLHQHGHAHLNHEAEGRRCEFGPSRSAGQQGDDLAVGRARLQLHFGARIDPIFTPPWNRCTGVTATVLRELGYAVLSRDRCARPETTMPELPIDIDWSRAWRQGGEMQLGAVVQRALQAREADGQPLGLMLHHAAMSPDEQRCLSRWLEALGHHPRLRWRPMRELLHRASATAPTQPSLQHAGEHALQRDAVARPASLEHIHR